MEQIHCHLCWPSWPQCRECPFIDVILGLFYVITGIRTEGGIRCTETSKIVVPLSSLSTATGGLFRIQARESQ